MTDKQRVVWVVEIKREDECEWRPRYFESNRDEAREEAAFQRAEYGRNARVVKYTPA